MNKTLTSNGVGPLQSNGLILEQDSIDTSSLESRNIKKLSMHIPHTSEEFKSRNGRDIFKMTKAITEVTPDLKMNNFDIFVPE